MLQLHANEAVLILGLGESGLAMAAWLAEQGAARIQVWDSREAAPQDAMLAERVPAAERLRGELHADQLQGLSRVLKSPGLAPHDERIARLLGTARERGIPVQGELDLFAEALAGLKREWRYEPAVLAITGTNGKTTTTSLTGLLCEAAGKRVAVAGNIGPTLLATLSAALAAEGPRLQQELPLDEALEEAAPEPAAESREASPEAPTEAAPEAAAEEPAEQGVSLEQLDELLEHQALPIAPPPLRAPVFQALPEVWVLELSSFQLDGVQGFEPTAAAVLNITQDHLDWHGDMAAYAAAKARIYGEQALMVVNRDDAAVEALVPQPPAPPIGARGKPLKVSVKWTPRQVCRFGLDAPQAAGDYGLLQDGGLVWLVRAMPGDDTPLKRGQARDEELQIQRLMPAEALRIRGRHNQANALAALALATAAGCQLAPMLHALRDYRGEPHRCEWLLSLAGVDFIDDSKGTNVGATVAAIAGLGADRPSSKLALILGGDGKGQDFEPLREPLARHARAVALIGRHEPTAAALAELLADAGCAVQRHDSLEAATAWAFAQCQAGDTVLLSPACASLDMFRNYAHRAEVFVAAARELAAERGEVL